MQGHGDDLRENRAALAAACVTVEGGLVCVRGPVNPRSGREVCVKFAAGVDVSDSLRDMLYDRMNSL